MATQIYDIVAGKAGKYVAGIRLNPGQTTIELTAEQARYEVDQGTIVATGQPGTAVPDADPVLATDLVSLFRAGLSTRPTVAELAAFVTASQQLLSAAGDIDLKGQRLFNGRVRINTYTVSVALTAADKGACVRFNHASARVVTLPADWAEGECVVIRRSGAGAVTWALAAGATIVVPASKAAHVGIAEQHEEALFKVISNAGNAAVWAVTGATA